MCNVQAVFESFQICVSDPHLRSRNHKVCQFISAVMKFSSVEKAPIPTVFGLLINQPPNGFVLFNHRLLNIAQMQKDTDGYGDCVRHAQSVD
jgi:hypothetical protein